MVYKIKLVSDEVNNFYRTIEIDADSTFLQLRNAILDSVGYSHDCIDSFAICTDDWEPQEEIVLEDLGLQTSDRDTYLMENTSISELVEDEGQKLVFIFDNLNERAFFMELKEISFGNSVDTPQCIGKAGRPPKQELDILPDVTEVKKGEGDLFTDLGLEPDENGYNDDDLDGLVEMDSEE